MNCWLIFAVATLLQIGLNPCLAQLDQLAKEPHCPIKYDPMSGRYYIEMEFLEGSTTVTNTYYFLYDPFTGKELKIKEDPNYDPIDKKELESYKRKLAQINTLAKMRSLMGNETSVVRDSNGLVLAYNWDSPKTLRIQGKFTDKNEWQITFSPKQKNVSLVSEPERSR